MFPRSEIFLFLEQQEQQLMSASTKEHGRASADYNWSVKKKRGTLVIYFENNSFHDQHKDWWTKLSGLLLKCKVKKQENRAFSEHVFASVWDLSNDQTNCVVKLSSCPAMLLTNFARALLSRQKINVDPNGIIIGSSSVRQNLKSLLSDRMVLHEWMSELLKTNYNFPYHYSESLYTSRIYL